MNYELMGLDVELGHGIIGFRKREDVWYDELHKVETPFFSNHFLDNLINTESRVHTYYNFFCNDVERTANINYNTAYKRHSLHEKLENLEIVLLKDDPVQPILKFDKEKKRYVETSNAPINAFFVEMDAVRPYQSHYTEDVALPAIGAGAMIMASTDEPDEVEEKYNAYFAERLEKLLESPSDKTHAYQLNNDIDTKHDDEVEPQTIKKVKEEINNNITCNPTQIQELIKAKAFKDGYAKKDDTISNVNIYYKEKVVGTSSYSFSGNVIDLTTPEKQTNIATNISKNLKNLLHVTDEEVETAIKATEKSEFSKDDVLSVKLECTSNTPSDEYYLKDYILDDNKATVDYSFDDTTEVYKDSDDRKKTINIIVDKINTKEKKKQANNIYYKTDYSAVDKVLPEKVYGTKDKDKQTKLDVQLTKVEIKYSYKKINKESIGNKTYIVVETDKPKDSIIKVKIYEKEPLLAEAGTTLKVLHATKETGLINTKSDGKGKAIGEITLRPHSDEKFDTWRKKLEPEAQTKLVDKLWLKVENKHEFLKGSEFELRKDEARIIINVKRIKEWAKGSTATHNNSLDTNAIQGGTISELEVLVDGKVELTNRFILEAAGPSSQISGKDDRIYAGKYYLIQNLGKDKEAFRLVQIDKDKVKDTFGEKDSTKPNGRYEVNIHVGNEPKNLVGCLCPGLNNIDMGDYPIVSTSGGTHKELSKLIKKSKTTKNIKTYDGLHSYNAQLLYEEVILIIKDEIK